MERGARALWEVIAIGILRALSEKVTGHCEGVVCSLVDIRRAGHDGANKWFPCTTIS
jgi:hypothetical protein